MNILATVNFGRAQWTQHWECMEDGEGKDLFLVVMPFGKGKILCVKLEPGRMQEVSGQKVYTGDVDIANAIAIPG